MVEWPAVVLARLLYRVSAHGLERLPASGGALLVSNHLSYVDALVLQLALPRRIRFVADGWLCRFWVLRWLFEWTRTIIADPAQPRRWMREVQEAVAAGEWVCLFPEAAISRTGQLMKLRPACVKIARDAGVPTIPVAIDGLWGSVFSFSGNRLLFKAPRLNPTPVQVCFGSPEDPQRLSLDVLRQRLLDLGCEAFSARPALQRHLGAEVVRGLCKRPLVVRLVDRTAARREFRSYELLVASILFAQVLRARVKGKRVGIVLPPGAGAVIANVAALIAGKTPVNLNFTAGPQAIQACLRNAGISTLVSATAVQAKLTEFPWTSDVVDLPAALQRFDRLERALWALVSILTPNQWMPRLLRLPSSGGDAEVGILYTSGSSGEPKGVVLSHRNVLANCWQISSLTILPESRSILACLPVFHSFGFTVTLWYPLLRGCRVVTIPSALDVRKTIDAIAEEEVAVLVSAPTFLRPLLKRARSAELRSLSLVVCGAERLPSDVEEGFRAQFHIDLMQGYGMTETSPVASVNQGAPPRDHGWAPPQFGRRVGSVGRLMPGMTARIKNVDTGEALGLGDTGLLHLRGANLFSGYLGDPERSALALRDGWYATGDLARFDDEGFLFVEGRLSRFSKIGGEMVPHGRVEDWLTKTFAPGVHEVPPLAVVGVPDSGKGEVLAIVATVNVRLEEVRSAMQDAGFAALWIPRSVCQVGELPRLGTGKVDFRACAALAAAAART